MLITTSDVGASRLKRSHPYQHSFNLKLKADVAIKPYENRLISIGVRVKIPKNELGLVIAKNSSNREGLLVFPTIHDSSFSGYIGVQCFNLSEETLYLRKGYAIAQLVILNPSNSVYEDCKDVSITEFMKLFNDGV